MLEKPLNLRRRAAPLLIGPHRSAHPARVVQCGLLLKMAEDGLLEAELHGGAIEHVALVRGAHDQPVHLHGLGLTDAVRASQRLGVVLGVPVAVKHDDGVRGDEVDPLTARARGKKKEKGAVLGVRGVVCVAAAAESVDGSLARSARDAAVEPLVGVRPVAAVVLENVQHARHLAEDERAMSTGLEARQELIEELKLAGARDELRRGGRFSKPLTAPLRHLLRHERLLDAVQEEGMLAALAHLHHEIAEVRKGSVVLAPLA